MRTGIRLSELVYVCFTNGVRCQEIDKIEYATVFPASYVEKCKNVFEHSFVPIVLYEHLGARAYLFSLGQISISAWPDPSNKAYGPARPVQK